MKMIQLIIIALVLIVAPCLHAAGTDKKIIAFAQDNMKNDFRKAQVFTVRDAMAANDNLSFKYSDA